MTVELLEGSEALAKAMISAGCRFFSGYPMTPFTEVLEGMDDLNVLTRQELEELMAELERQIADAEPES